MYKLYLTHRRLMLWGHWCNHIITMGLGHSSQSILSRLQENGTLIDYASRQSVPDNEEAEEVENLLDRLAAKEPAGRGKPEWVKVVRLHYTLYDKSSHARIKVSGFNSRTYYHYLKSAQHWVCDNLYG